MYQLVIPKALLSYRLWIVVYEKLHKLILCKTIKVALTCHSLHVHMMLEM